MNHGRGVIVSTGADGHRGFAKRCLKGVVARESKGGDASQRAT